MIHGLSAFALLFCLASCGSKGSGSNNNQTATDLYNRCGSNQNCNNQQFTQQYGPNSQGYYQGTQNYGGAQCQVYNVPNYQQGCNYGCGQQQYIVAPQGAYIPSQGIYGQGGSFYASFGYSQGY